MGKGKEAPEDEASARQRRERPIRSIECSLLLSLLPDHVLLLDADLRIWYANYASPGLSVDDLIGAYLPDYSDPEVRPSLERTLRRVLETGEPETYEAAYRPPKGPAAFYESHVRPYKDGLFVLAHDITKRKAALQALQQSEERFRMIAESSADAIFLVDLDGRYRFANDAATALFGYTFDEFLTMSIGDLSIETGRAGTASRFPKLVEKGGLYEEMRLRRKDGTTVHVDLNATALPNGLIYGSCRDISDRKRAEAALRESERILNETGRMARIGGWEHDLRTRKAVWTRALYDIIEMDPSAEPPGPDEHLEFYPPPSRDILRDAFERAIRDAVPFDLELEVHTTTGRHLWGRATGEAVHQNGRCVKLRGTFQDIDARKTAELAQQETERALRTLMGNLPGMAYRCANAPSWPMDFVSEGALAVTGYTEQELIGSGATAFNDLIVPEDRSRVWETIQRGVAREEPFEIEYRIRAKNGEERWVRERGRAIAPAAGRPAVLEGFITDITAQRTLEAQVRQNQRLESIGTLASGVAHEINNPLMGMINYAELIQSDAADERIRDFAREIVQEGTRVARIVRNLLSFARQQPEETSPARLTDIITRSLSLLGTTLRRDGIAVIIEVPEDLPSIRCRSQQIEQVFINLLTNAQASLNARYPARDEDKLIFLRAFRSTRSDGDWIRTTVEDHGEGIPTALIDRIFDPFVSGRTRDKGTGLGLSISYGIISAHGGELSVESEPGDYARFHIDLPLG